MSSSPLLLLPPHAASVPAAAPASGLVTLRRGACISVTGSPAGGGSDVSGESRLHTAGEAPPPRRGIGQTPTARPAAARGSTSTEEPRDWARGAKCGTPSWAAICGAAVWAGRALWAGRPVWCGRGTPCGRGIPVGGASLWAGTAVWAGRPCGWAARGSAPQGCVSWSHRLAQGLGSIWDPFGIHAEAALDVKGAALAPQPTPVLLRGDGHSRVSHIKRERQDGGRGRL